MDASRKPPIGSRLFGSSGRQSASGGSLPPRPPRVAIGRAGASGLSSSLLLRRPGSIPEPSVTAHVPFGLPNLRRNVCQHFYVTGSRGAIPLQAPHLLKGLLRHESNIARCQLRGGVHLEQSYVTDICLSSRFNQCVFYEDELSAR